ncbi:MAG: hypothetical protein KatS3mg131_2227 [Candidatus Tectimicrobiota bacterium]|nr:MAG: hypothetical protein KatS3mg131_2227 [Candidatus Tectomicrobia bacterium]
MGFALANATAYAVAMAYLEATIVVYLRRLYYPEGFTFPLKVIDLPTMWLELGREACTLVMLATVAIAAGRSRAGKLAFFLFLFGVWDIFYYVWLKVFLNWPPSLLTWDVLFLIPVPWVGPVLAPVCVALTMIGMALVLLRLEARGPVPAAGAGVWLAQGVAALAIILSFTLDVLPRLAPARLEQWVPTAYRWWLLFASLALAIGAFGRWAVQAWRAQKPAVPQR